MQQGRNHRLFGQRVRHQRGLAGAGVIEALGLVIQTAVIGLQNLHRAVIEHHIIVVAFACITAGAVQILDAGDAQSVEVLGRGLVGTKLVC